MDTSDGGLRLRPQPGWNDEYGTSGVGIDRAKEGVGCDASPEDVQRMGVRGKILLG
jgi:hypothetical protein